MKAASLLPTKIYTCNIQYVGKSDRPFNIRVSNHRQDFKNPNAIPAWKHFSKHDYDFNNHGKFIIIEQLRNIRITSTETLKETLKKQENFWIMKLETLAPRGLNQDLNWGLSVRCHFFIFYFFQFCIWSKKNDVSRTMTSNILQYFKSQILHIPWERPRPN